MLTRIAAVLVALGLVAGGSAALRHHAGDDAAVAAAGTPAAAGASGIGDPYYPLDGNGGINVLSYDVRDRYRFATGRLTGKTVLTLRTTQDLSSFDLDFLLPVSRVRLSTGPSTFSRPEHHELQISPSAPIPAHTQVRVTVKYAGKPGRYSYAGESNWLATTVVT